VTRITLSTGPNTMQKSDSVPPPYYDVYSCKSSSPTPAYTKNQPKYVPPKKTTSHQHVKSNVVYAFARLCVHAGPHRFRRTPRLSTKHTPPKKTTSHQHIKSNIVSTRSPAIRTRKSSHQHQVYPTQENDFSSVWYSRRVEHRLHVRSPVHARKSSIPSTSFPRKRLPISTSS